MNITLIKEKLEEELQHAQQEKAELDEQLDEKPDFGPGTGSTGAYTWEMALSRRERIDGEIEALEAALARIQDGTYGTCEHCGKPIEAERLEILPTTTYCIVCAGKLN